MLGKYRDSPEVHTFQRQMEEHEKLMIHKEEQRLLRKLGQLIHKEKKAEIKKQLLEQYQVLQD